MDDHKNFAYSIVATAPSPATTGLSLSVVTGEGTRFPTPPFNATVWPAGTIPIPTNAEIIRVTGIAADAFTITRAQESSSARAIVVGDQIAATITDLMLEALHVVKDDVPFDAGNFTGSGAMTWGLAAGDQIEFVYWREDAILNVSGYFNTTSVGGVADVTLRTIIPGGFTPDATVIDIARVDDAAGVFAAGVVFVLNGGNYIGFQKIDSSNWTLSTNQTVIQFSIGFPIQL